MTRTRVAAVLHAAIGGLLLVGIWLALPARYWLVDVAGTAVAVCAWGAALGLFLHKPWGVWVGRVVAWVELVAGTLTVTALAWSAAILSGSYGPVGGGGALLMVIVAFLVLPYLVVLPAAQLIVLRDAP